MFQSTPGNYAGRINASCTAKFSASLFQSTPGNYAGRIFPLLMNTEPMFVVSIHSRQLCRENPTTRPIPIWTWTFQSTPGNYAGRIRAAGGGAGRLYGFNPLPAIMPGESVVQSVLKLMLMSFNPLPAIMPGESTLGGVEISAWGFQSTPGNYAGRITSNFFI